MRCCFVAEIILVPREQTRSGGRQSKPVMSCCLSFALELLFMELLFALELLFIIRPGAPDHGAAGAPLLVLFIIRPGAPDHGAAGCL